MTGNAAKILFLTPSLSNTGSEVLLFQFINHLAGRYQISVICFGKGVLSSRLDPRIKVHIQDLTTPKTLAGKLRRRITIHLTTPLLFARYKHYHWYVNTIALPLPLQFAAEHGVHHTVHVHELKHMYGLLDQQQFQRLIHSKRAIIANSEISAKHLTEAGRAGNIRIVKPFIDLGLFEKFRQPSGPVSQENGWVMAGSIDANKNPALFVAIAQASVKAQSNMRFTWLYQNISDQTMFDDLNQTIAAQNLPLRFVRTADYNGYLQQFSAARGLILTSNFESFSLVTLEALALGLPMVLTDCGGVREILGPDLATFLPPGSPPQVYVEAALSEEKKAERVKADKWHQALKFAKQEGLQKWEKILQSIMQE